MSSKLSSKERIKRLNTENLKRERVERFESERKKTNNLKHKFRLTQKVQVKNQTIQKPPQKVQKPIQTIQKPVQKVYKPNQKLPQIISPIYPQEKVIKELQSGISIIITAYKVDKYIEECLDSFSRQSYFMDHDNYEIILGIDACEQTLNKVKAIIHKYNKITIFYFSENKGTYIVSNTLASFSKYDHLLRFDSDDIALPNMITTLMNNSKSEILLMKFQRYDTVSRRLSPISDEGARGCIFVPTDFFLSVGGFMPWRISADSEFLIRVKNNINIKTLSVSLFHYRKNHGYSATINPETKMGSKMRNDYRQMHNNNYNSKIVKIDFVINSNYQIIDHVTVPIITPAPVPIITPVPVPVPVPINRMETDKNILTIIMTLYNKEKYVVNSIKSVINQRSKNWELIIINDASTDNSYSLVRQFLSDSRIKLHNLEKNYGTYVCTNLAIQGATGKYICRLDADDTLVPKAVERIIATFEKNPQKDIVRFNSNQGKYTEIGIAYKKEIISRVGYYDSVRFGADSEFKERLAKIIPSSKFVHIDETLYLVHSVPNSLTTSKATQKNGSHRKNYMAEYRNWHKKCPKCFMEFPQTSRPFPVYDIMKTSYP